MIKRLNSLTSFFDLNYDEKNSMIQIRNIDI